MAEEMDGFSSREDGTVVEKWQSGGWLDLIKLEDYWAMWLAFILIIPFTIIYLSSPPKDMHSKIDRNNAVMKAENRRAPFKTVAWYEAFDAKQKIKASRGGFGKFIKKWTTKPQKWTDNPLKAFYLSKDAAKVINAKNRSKYDTAKAKVKELKSAALEAEAEAAAAGFQNNGLNNTVKKNIQQWRAGRFEESKAKKKASVKPYNLFPTLIGLMLFIDLFFSVGIKGMGKQWGRFIVGFMPVFIIGVISYMLNSQTALKHYGIGYAVWGIFFGMLISNTIGTPEWVKPGAQVEFFIKTGLVLLGAEILFNKIVAIGTPGVFIAWVCTPVVLLVTYWFGQRVIKMPSKTLNIVVSADMSVCGTSAAIATAAACRAKKEELTLAIGLSLVFTSLMMIAMPLFIKAVEMPDVLAGAWLGGTIDATGAVAAAGAFISERAMYVAATIKMIQNILIGVVAFCVALYWVTRVERVPGQEVHAMEIWWRFPKFVLGFVLASIIFSWMYGSMGDDVGYSMLDQGVIRGGTRIFRGWFFCLSFVAIGLESDFRKLRHYFKGGKPLILYVFGQSLQILLSLLMAYIAFYILFPHITARI
jgi:uncharacterized integral membrane protein (TIGR00698 family)